jgi:hypothetical protein
VDLKSRVEGGDCATLVINDRISEAEDGMRRFLTLILTL